MFSANYHTHTFRCGHAIGTEREYIENAIKAGLKELGFSDHVPMPFPDGHESDFRMKIADIGNYVSTLKALRDEYSDRIKIFIGYEAEYYPAYFDSMLELITGYDIDYLILGQHFIYNEQSNYLGNYATSDSKLLSDYVDTVCDGISTGKFSYVAHPDLIRFEGDEDFYLEQMTRLCLAAKKADMPLEMNMMGAVQGWRCYPSKRFFTLAGKLGCDVIIGFDAHEPNVMLGMAENLCREFLSECNIVPIDYLKLKKVK